jgi:hypothetical protein
MKEARREREEEYEEEALFDMLIVLETKAIADRQDEKLIKMRMIMRMTDRSPNFMQSQTNSS